LLINVTTQEKNNEICQLFGVVTDTTDRVIQSQEIEYRAKHDGLTGLPNRGYFIEQTEAVLSLAGKNDKHALLMLDLDGFKEVNDTLGHETGDELLKDIGPRLKTVLSNLVSIEARLGGDEFAVFIEDYEDENQLRGLASEIMAAIKSPFAIHGLELSVGGSIGIATYPEMSASISSMMRCADIAMYQAKRQSKDYALYNTDSDHYTVRRLSLMMDVRQAITNNELQLFYQPIMSLENQQVSGFEGLIRWQHPELGMLSPGEFIPLIELTDMIMPVTWWVVETAIKQLADWRKLGWEYSVSVNVSTRNLVDVRFVSFIEDCLAKHNVEGQYLEIEITESTLMADPDKSREVLQSIAALGVNISIDDYGTGYSSLAYLKSLPINTLKIDRAFISQMLLNPQDKIIVNSTIQLAHNLGLKVTAEGIEDLSVISDLKALGCDKGQGFYYCKPISVEKLTVWLASRDSA
jgi:diguanylate cyclase (GGDEF)-like protein